MIPLIDFAEVTLDEIKRSNHDIFKDIGLDIAEALSRDQFPGLRISDVGTCSLSLWAKVNKLLQIAEDPQNMWSRLQMGTIVGAVIGRYFKAAMDRNGIECVLERAVTFKGMPGHIDIVLPTYRHLYELKSNYGIKYTEPKASHVKQAGMYALACEAEDGHEYTASVVMLQVSLQGKTPRIKEHHIDDFDFAQNAIDEAERLVRAAHSTSQPMADVNPKDKSESWQCSFCRFAGCARNVNPLR